MNRPIRTVSIFCLFLFLALMVNVTYLQFWHAEELNEVYLRMAVRSQDKAVAERFGRLFPPLGLSGPPFVGGYGGITSPRELLGIWPTLAPRALVEPRVQVHMAEVTA